MAPPPEHNAAHDPGNLHLQPPTYAEVLSLSPDELAEGEGFSLENTAVVRHRRWQPYSTTARASSEPSSVTPLGVLDLDPDARDDPNYTPLPRWPGVASEDEDGDEDEQERTLEDAFDQQGEELMRRGTDAQRRRRRRIVTRPRDEAAGDQSQAQTSGTSNALDASIEEELSSSYAYRHQVRASSPDELQLLPLLGNDGPAAPSPGRASPRRPQRRLNVRRQESIFFPPPSDSPGGRLSSFEGARPMRLPMTSRSPLSFDSSDDEATIILRRANARRARGSRGLCASKAVLLLYCHPGHSEASGASDARSPRSPSPEIPEGFYRVDPSPSTSQMRTTRQEREDHSTAARRGGGGCGILVCARGAAKEGADLYESDAPPISRNVDWLELENQEESHKSASGVGGDGQSSRGTSAWRACHCVKALLGCRNCGNVIGSSVVSACSRCTRHSQGNRWLFYASAVASRERPRYLDPPAYLEPSSLSQNNKSSSHPSLRWVPSDLPTISGDCLRGLAGDPEEWKSQASAFFESSSRMQPSENTSSMATSSAASSDQAARSERSARVWRILDNIQSLADYGSRDIDMAVREPSSVPRPSSSALAVPQVDPATQTGPTGGSAPTRLATHVPGVGTSGTSFQVAAVDDILSAGSDDILERARMLRRDLREFVNRNYGGTQNGDETASRAVGLAASAMGSRDVTYEEQEQPRSRIRRRSLSPLQSLESAGLEFLEVMRASRRRRLEAGGAETGVLVEDADPTQTSRLALTATRDGEIVGR